MLPKIFALLYPLIVWIVLVFAFKFLKLRRLTKHRLRIPDVFILFLIYGLHVFSKQFTNLTILPYYFLIISSLALIILLLDLFYYKEFRYRRFLKLFWRIAFIITFVLYIAMIIMIFLK